ncbi:MAG: helix-turn-helix domain-containing protein [Paracoccaceae bacterium]
MTLTVHSTDQTAPAQRAAMWNAVIAETYFPLRLTFRCADRFEGRISRRELGRMSVSRLTTEPLQYERRPTHISGSAEEEYLVTIPAQSPVVFRQLGREVRCEPGGFILERGDEPYRFLYESRNDLYVMKVARSVLAERVRDPDRLCARVFDGRAGIGALFSSMVRNVHDTGAGTTEAAQRVLGRQLLELLTLALDEGEGIEIGLTSGVRAAHLARVDRVIRDNLANPALSPEMVAQACGISKRYLHELFRHEDCTVAQRTRERRLIAARDMLEAQPRRSIAEIAYRFGFSEQAHFSRLFRAAFGETPSGYRARLAAQT